jgi:hypothetical protein
LFLCPFYSYTQTLSPEGIFSSAGNHNIDGYAQISWTLGDVMTTRLNKAPNLILTQGFLQTRMNIKDITDLPELSKSGKESFKLFPNPVSDILYIRKEKNTKEKIGIELYSMDGKLILNRNFKTESEIDEINFTNLNSGTYFLKVFSIQNKYAYTYKVVYQN